MKKVSIYTRHATRNFGAVLQAYALQNTIKKMGYDCSIVDIRRNKISILSSWRSVSGIVNNIFYRLHKDEFDRGCARFERFISEEYKLTRRYNNEYELFDNPPGADVYIAGSDQVWNPLAATGCDFLGFAEENAIRASYAASMAISYMPGGLLRLYKQYLDKMDYISVRERTAKELLYELNGTEAEVNVDPTLLFSAEEWNKLAVKPKIKEPYILCYILYKPEGLNDFLKKIHKETGKRIVLVSFDPYRNIYHNEFIRDAGPKEFLGLIQNADIVIASSFHGIALSIANKKPFYAIVNKDMPSRITDLLKTFELEDRIADVNGDFTYSDIDYEKVEKIRLEQRVKSIEYLKKVIEGQKKENENKTEKPSEKNISNVGEKCTACTACANACPKKAITMKPDKEGFLYPIIDKELCVNCGVCVNKCHACSDAKETKYTSDVFYGWHKDKEIRRKSTSGGAFSALSQGVLKKGGLVVAAYFNDVEKKVMHASSDDIEFARFRKSKYVESEMGDVMTKIKTALEKNRQVLFCGTPCQASGVRKVFGYDENLIICDFLCHGVPSGKVFEDYLKLEEKKNKSKIKDYMFRTKTFGWEQYGVDVKFENKTKHTVGRCEWFYVAGMLDDLFLRKSCYTCDKALYHESDITIGDVWGVFQYNMSLNDGKGISLIIANNDRGRKIISDNENMEVFPVDKKYIDYTLKPKKSDKKISGRNKKFSEYQEIGIENFINKYYKKRMLKYRLVFKLKKGQFTKKGKKANE